MVCPNPENKKIIALQNFIVLTTLYPKYNHMSVHTSILHSELLHDKSIIHNAIKKLGADIHTLEEHSLLLVYLNMNKQYIRILNISQHNTTDCSKMAFQTPQLTILNTQKKGLKVTRTVEQLAICKLATV